MNALTYASIVMSLAAMALAALSIHYTRRAKESATAARRHRERAESALHRIRRGGEP